jgi:hypothetical protein
LASQGDKVTGSKIDTTRSQARALYFDVIGIFGS